MRNFVISTLLLLSVFTVMSAQSVRNVFGFPATEPGYSLGVSACYAGQIGDYIVMAGGCNFPTPGNKTYYAGIYAAPLDNAVLRWQLVGFLPEPAAYGATIASGDSLMFVGGNNSDHSLNTVYSIHLNAAGDRAEVRRMADLPCTVDNMAAAIDRGNVYIVGGNQNGKPSAGVLMADIKTENYVWSDLCTMPSSPRVQPVCAANNGKLYVWGGFFADGEKSVVSTDGVCLDTTVPYTDKTWRSLEGPRSAKGEPMTLSGGVAWTDGNKVFATGGVNKDIFLDAISGRYECVKKTDYLLQPIEWYSFSGNLYELDLVTQKWKPTRFADKALARAGAMVVPTTLGTFYIGGELKPSVRTPQIVLILSVSDGLLRKAGL